MSERQYLRLRQTRSMIATVGALALAAGLGLPARGAAADVLASSFNVNPQLAGAGGIIVDLNGPAAGVDLPVPTPALSRIAISFDAECSVAGAGFVTWATIDILVDPAPPGGGFFPIQPTTGNDDSFCTTNGTFPQDGWVNPSRTVVTRVPAGVNTVRVLARTVNGAGPSRLDDLSIDVEN